MMRLYSRVSCRILSLLILSTIAQKCLKHDVHTKLSEESVLGSLLTSLRYVLTISEDGQCLLNFCPHKIGV